jgi:uncharacterized protein YjiS (DUF1127 family)
LSSLLAGRFRQRRARTLSGSALAVLAAMLSWIGRWRERSRVRPLLAAMSERELQDIGVCRSDIARQIGHDIGIGK